MSWLTPLGFLGLISILVLVIIYIIKPNYENKFISSTYVWKLSLKYKKNKIPINKLRNIILFICQVLALTAATLIIAQPFLDNGENQASEKVLIVDASASMMTKTGGSSRFERAIDEVSDEIDEQLNKEDGKVTVIIASDKASFLIQSEGIESKDKIKDELAKLKTDEGNPCTWGKSDIEGAIALSEEITSIKEGVEVSLFTDVNYVDSGKVKVNLVNDVNDFNVAILDVRAVTLEGYIRFEIDVVSYGRSDSVNLNCTINGVNGMEDEEGILDLKAVVRLESDVVTTVAFGKIYDEVDEFDVEMLENIEVTSFDTARVWTDEKDSFDTDNNFWLYGGKLPTLKIQYYSEKPNNYFASAFMILRNQLKYRWDVQITEVSPDETPESEGFDFYIYEHKMPSSLPKDGFVLLVNPDNVPIDAGFKLNGESGYYQETPLEAGDELAQILPGINAEMITVTRYSPITLSDGYTPLLLSGGKPVFIVKNETDEKIAVMSFSLHYSNLPVMMEFPLMMYRLVEYYMPSTVTQRVFDVNDTVKLGARSDELVIEGPGLEETVTEFPKVLTLTEPGPYTATQTPISGVEAIDNFFVRVPASESEINRQEDALENPYFYEKVEDTKVDLLIFFASALVALLFIEWWLHTREQYQIGKQK